MNQGSNMIKFVVVIFVVGLAPQAAWARSSRIVGSELAAEGQFPYIVSFQQNSDHFCAGSIINRRWILTTAHCVDRKPPFSMNVLIGTLDLGSGGTLYKVENYMVHDQYDDFTRENNIALVKLSTAIQFNANIKPVILNSEQIGGGYSTMYAGWGSDDFHHTPGPMSALLRYHESKTITPAECRLYHSNPPIFDTQICSIVRTDQGVCKGDAGSPVTDLDGRQMGIVSEDWTCGQLKPDVYTGVYYYLDWINENIVESK